jgi:DNA-directed RNA polymerase specialized sigma24 family protein
MGSVELPIRLSLRRFVRAVDSEAILQETYLRMWVYARDRGGSLEGEDASLRFAIGMARNLARAEARRTRREIHLPPESMPELPTAPEPPSDPGLRRAILGCIEKVAGKPLQALRARAGLGPTLPDRDIAAVLGMTLNTFLQNVVRARKQVAACLERHGISLREVVA